jgi:hypothetical protein
MIPISFPAIAVEKQNFLFKRDYREINFGINGEKLQEKYGKPFPHWTDWEGTMMLVG